MGVPLSCEQNQWCEMKDRHPYAGRLTKDEAIIIGDMTKSMIKPINIVLTLNEHYANSYTTMK